MARESGDRFSIGSNVDLTGVDLGLLSAVRTASASLPPGWRAEVTSGERKGDPRFHGQGKALDVQLIDAQGNRLPNYQSAENFRPYEQFAQAVHAAQPSGTAPIRWGGYFGGPKGTYGAVDLMHFDVGNVPMGGGSWEGGLTDAQRKLFPGAQSVGYGTQLAASSTPVAGSLANQEIGPENAGGGAPVASSTGPQDPRQIVFNKLVAAGVPPQAALGALWSLGGEGGKGLDPRSYNAKDPGGSIGYGQWNRERRTALEDLAKQNGTSWADPNTQADHIINELTNKDYASYQPGVFDKLKAATTPEEAARIWTGGFERPAKDNSDARIKGGPQVATLDDSGNLVLGSAVGGGPAPNTGYTPATTVATAPSAAPPTDDRPWYAKAFGSLMQGKDGKKSPFEQFSDAMVGSGPKEQQAAMEAQAPAKSALASSGPGARNVSPGLQNVAQTYGQTINSISQPLTWNSAPPQAPNLPAAGLLPTPGYQAPGITLNSVQPLPQGVGYGINPVGYGFG